MSAAGNNRQDMAVRADVLEQREGDAKGNVPRREATRVRMRECKCVVKRRLEARGSVLYVAEKFTKLLRFGQGIVAKIGYWKGEEMDDGARS